MVETCIKSTVFGMKNENLHHSTAYLFRMTYFELVGQDYGWLKIEVTLVWLIPLDI